MAVWSGIDKPELSFESPQQLFEEFAVLEPFRKRSSSLPTIPGTRRVARFIFGTAIIDCLTRDVSPRTIRSNAEKTKSYALTNRRTSERRRGNCKNENEKEEENERRESRAREFMVARIARLFSEHVTFSAPTVQESFPHRARAGNELAATARSRRVQCTSAPRRVRRTYRDYWPPAEGTLASAPYGRSVPANYYAIFSWRTATRAITLYGLVRARAIGIS